MAWRESGKFVDINVSMTFFPDDSHVTIYWPLCGMKPEEAHQTATYIMGFEDLPSDIAREFGSIDRAPIERIIDAYAAAAIDRRIVEEFASSRGPGVLGEGDVEIVCLLDYVEIDDDDESIVIGRPYRRAGAHFRRFLEILTRDLGIELHIDHPRRSFVDAFGDRTAPLSYGEADQQRMASQEIYFNELALVLIDMLMEEGVVSLDLLIGSSDYGVSSRDLARALAWHLVIRQFPGPGDHVSDDGVLRHVAAMWPPYQHEWLSSLEVPYVGYDEKLLDLLSERWR